MSTNSDGGAAAPSRVLRPGDASWLAARLPALLGDSAEEPVDTLLARALHDGCPHRPSSLDRWSCPPLPGGLAEGWDCPGDWSCPALAVLEVLASRTQRFAPRLGRTLRRRYARCTAPVCRRLSIDPQTGKRMDLDHAVEWSRGGRTATGNAAPRCRRCPYSRHTASRRDGSPDLKTHHGWRVMIDRARGSSPRRLPAA